SEELRLEPRELADPGLAVVLRVDVLQAVDVVHADVGDARIGERDALALDEIGPVRIAHQVPVGLRILVRGHQLRVDVEPAHAREDLREMRLLAHDRPAPLDARVERRRLRERLADAAPRERAAALAAALVHVRLHTAGRGLRADLFHQLIARPEDLAHLDLGIDLVEELDGLLGFVRLRAAVPDDLAFLLRRGNDLALPLRHHGLELRRIRRGHRRASLRVHDLRRRTRQEDGHEDDEFHPIAPFLAHTRRAPGDTSRRARLSTGSRASGEPVARTLTPPTSTTYSTRAPTYTDARTIPTQAPSRSAAVASAPSGRNATTTSCPSSQPSSDPSAAASGSVKPFASTTATAPPSRPTEMRAGRWLARPRKSMTNCVRGRS